MTASQAASPSRAHPWIVYLTGIVVMALGLALLGGGAWLVALSGSAWYLVAGVGLTVSGALLLARRREALFIYGLVLIGTLVWALSEVGLDFWPLAARGDLIWPIGIWLLTPWVVRPLRPEGRRADVWPLALAVIAGAVVLGLALMRDPHEILGLAGPPSAAPASSPDQPDADWRAYGRTQGGLRYSPLAQITPANAARLKVAWTFRTGDAQGLNDPTETTFEVTPIKVGDSLYLCSQHQRLFALDPATGRLKWSFDPKVKDNPTFQHLTCRGVSYHEDAGAAPGADCPRRIFLPVNDGRLYALDADTGRLCQGFGDHGVIDLEQGLGILTSGFYEPTSPPVVGDRILVVNGAVIDNYSTREPSGVVRGYDLHTGALVWAWDSGAADENHIATPGHPYTIGSPNSWMTMAYDPALGLVYLPMGVETPDIWGGDRSALSERYSSALVALDINTGRRVWSYQTVHHDLWDMDLPSQPTLVDLPTAAGVVPAIVQPAKTGMIFVLDRRDGRLIVPAPERPVPQGPAPGDRLSPTQPFSALSFRPPGRLTGADMWGATILDQLACRIMFHRLRYDGVFTPPSLQGTLVFPGNLGMFEWGGVAVDPARRIAIANPMVMPFVSRLVPRGPGNPAAPNGAHPPGTEIGVQPMYGAPFGVDLHPFTSPVGLPCMHPPWGYIAAIDLGTMKVAWQRINGTIRDTAPVPIPLKMGVPMLGGPMTTAGGVAFLTSTMDDYIRAYDVRTGRQLWQDRLPAGGQSTPMTYAAGGRQFVVTAAGGHGSFHTRRGDYVIAYALP